MNADVRACEHPSSLYIRRGVIRRTLPDGITWAKMDHGSTTDFLLNWLSRTTMNSRSKSMRKRLLITAAVFGALLSAAINPAPAAAAHYRLVIFLLSSA